MQEDFHYYGTYCAAFLAGFSHHECLDICYSDQLVDLFSTTLLTKLEAPLNAATTQLKLEMMETPTDPLGIQYITRIWSSFHFLPADLYANPGRGGRSYKAKYRLICGPNGALVADTVQLARGKGPQATGIAMHVLADTWAHRYFAGTPSLCINNVSRHMVELVESAGEVVERPVTFSHNPAAPDDMDAGIYNNTIYQSSENAIMNLGHGRAGHLPDYSFARYRYLPAWGNYEEILKDNPSDYWNAFCQMVYALQYLRGVRSSFELNTYATDVVAPWKDRIMGILVKRQLDSCDDWRALGESLSGQAIPPFDLDAYQGQYMSASSQDKDETFLGQFVLAALAQKSMITNRIYSSGNPLAGHSIDYRKKGFGGIKDYLLLLKRPPRQDGGAS